MSTIQRAKPIGVAALAYAVLTIAYTWPLPIHLMHGVAHDPGDPLLNAWILWWTTRAVPLTVHWWNPPIFYPAAGTLAFSEHLLGQAPIAAPLIALTGSPLFGYNVTLLFTYFLSGLGAHFLAFRVTRRHDAAFVAGLAFAFGPYRVAQLPHFQVLSSFWTPICLALLHRYDERPNTTWAALAAVAWLMQALSNGYYLFFLSVLIALWLAWFAVGRWPRAKLVRLGVCFAGAAILLTPVLQGYRSVLVDTYGFSRDIGGIRDLSADVGSLLQASDEVWLWGWLHAVPKLEGELFPGLTIVALALFAIFASRPFAVTSDFTRRRWWLQRLFVALFFLFAIAATLPVFAGTRRLSIGGVQLVSISRADKPLTLAALAAVGWLTTLPAMVGAARRRSVLAFYALAAFAMWVFALGPEPRFFGHQVLYQAPYGWLMRLPGFDGLRAPARFWMMSLACLSVLAALAINRLEGPTRRLIVWIAAIGLVLDGWPREFRVRAEPERRPTPAAVSARLDLPMTPARNVQALYQQTFDGVVLYNGFSGYGPPHEYAMGELLAACDARILQALTSHGSLGVVIDHEADAEGAYRRFIMAYPGATLVETRSAWSSYRLPGNGGGELLPDQTGQVVKIKALSSSHGLSDTRLAMDGNLKTRWRGGVQRSLADFTIELVDTGPVSQVVLDLGEYWADFPVLVRLAVSSDGAQWQTAYVGGSALQAYYAGLRHPKSMPLVFPVNRDSVRFIRLEQMGSGPHEWSIAEVRVLR